MPTSKLLLLAILSVPRIAFAVDASTAPATTQAADASETTSLEGFVAPRDPFEAKVELKNFSGPLNVKQVVAHGAAVRQGEALLAFDTTQIDDQILLAASEVEVSTANLAKAEADVSLGDRSDAAGLEQHTDAVHDAELTFDFWKRQDGPDFLKQLDLQLKMGQYGVDDQNDELNQLRQMYQSESLTNATADIVVKRAVRQLEMTQQSFEIQKAETAKQRQTTYVDKQQEVERGLASAKQALDQFNAETSQARAARANATTQARVALRAAQRKLSELEQDKAALAITTPTEGIAFFGAFKEGVWQNAKPEAIKVNEKADAGGTLLTVVRAGKVTVTAKASDEQITKLTVGQSVRVTVSAVGGEAIDGKISTLSPLPSSDGTFEVGIELSAEREKLMPGMKAKIEVVQ